MKTKKKSKKAMVPIHGPEFLIMKLKLDVQKLEKRIERLENESEKEQWSKDLPIEIQGT